MLALGLSQYAESQGIGIQGVDLFVRLMPDSPDNAICLYDEPRTVSSETQSYSADSFGSHWMIRGTYAFASQKALEIHRSIAGLHGELDGIHILDTHIQTPPAFVENDARGRTIYSIHYIHDCNIGQN